MFVRCIRSEWVTGSPQLGNLAVRGWHRMAKQNQSGNSISCCKDIMMLNWLLFWIFNCGQKHPTTCLPAKQYHSSKGNRMHLLPLVPGCFEDRLWSLTNREVGCRMSTCLLRRETGLFGLALAYPETIKLTGPFETTYNTAVKTDVLVLRQFFFVSSKDLCNTICQYLNGRKVRNNVTAE